MNCSSCKRPNADGLDFCDFCGTPLGAAGPGKRKTEMEGVTTPKHKTEMERGPTPLDPFAPPPGSAKTSGVPSAPAPAGPGKARTVFDSPKDGKDPFAPAVGGTAQAPKRDDARYAGRRITGFLITFDRSPDGRFFVLREGRNMLGRSGDCDVMVDDDENVSSEHAIVLCRNGRTVIDDEKSMNGTFLNGEDVMEKTDVKDGDVVRLGKTTNLLCRLLDMSKLPAAAK